ncbi:hypothetical protein ACG873_09895 [Mesorhizobium sp. AaZ16]|uniref:hypothetical protein n=1 Tax=Mesorhizobium sp. AaZ16 TaxID=3402289 RepID=UPI00374EBE0A
MPVDYQCTDHAGPTPWSLRSFFRKSSASASLLRARRSRSRRRYFTPVFGAFVEERLVRAVVSFAELIGGLFLVIAHNIWAPLPAAIISILGWMAVIEATAYLLLPDDMLEKFIGTFNVPAWYLVGGIFAILVGIYLAGFGFGWW